MFKVIDIQTGKVCQYHKENYSLQLQTTSYFLKVGEKVLFLYRIVFVSPEVAFEMERTC